MNLIRFIPVCFIAGLCVYCSALGPDDLGAQGARLVKRVKAMSSEGDWKKPDFCNGLDCPQFKVVDKTDEYEVREYNASRWVSTHLEKIGYNAAVSEMFQKLFQYIQGENVKKEKIDMTAPVIVRIIPGPGPACVNNFTLSFFIAPKMTDPPAPTNKEVFLSELPAQKVYVKSFGGRAYEKNWLEEEDKLATALQKDGKKFVKDHSFTAGYDSPFKFFNRHNEVWIIAADK